MKIGDKITTILPDGRPMHATVTALRPLIGTTPFEGFAWDIADNHGRGSYYRFDRVGIDWIHGWHSSGSEDFDAFLAARLLILSQGDRR